ncbi:MAG TPA: hypothetical protein PK431_01495 [Chitinophagales bacterium]|nr:hypothetical protein [Chitinophagales bacterium]
MDEQLNDEFQKNLNRMLSGFFISLAILEDYADVVSKLTDGDKEVIKKRILDNATKKLEESKK